MQKVLDTVKNDDISILVNNVGVLPLGTLHETSITQAANAISVNVSAQTYMT